MVNKEEIIFFLNFYIFKIFTKIGMRFALLEIKLTLNQLLRKYTIVKTNSTIEKLKYEEGLGIRRPANKIKVIFIERDKLNAKN